MEEIEVVTCFLRHGGEVLLLRRSDDVGSYPGRWGAVAGHAEGDPDAAARVEVAEETGLDDNVTLLRRGEAFAVVDADRGTRWVVYPYLFESDNRAVETNWENHEHEWVHPTEIRRRETVPDLWESYDRVRPTVETITADREHGSAWLSIRALEVLRDEAEVAVHEKAGDWESVTAIARRLLDARPSMPVVSNRVNRVLSRADRTPAAVEATARQAIADALGADEAAAATAVERLPDRIATLSRSGTVRAVLEQADPKAVLVAESRPGGEGVAVAESLAGGINVTLTSDAGLAWAIHEWGADAVLVGADAISPDGTVRNKVGTRSAALAASHEGIDVVVVAAADKISPEMAFAVDATASAPLYDGPADLSVRSPLFDVTPAALIDAICTEQGILDPARIEAIAADHRANADWTA